VSGLTLEATREDIYQALIEGLTYDLAVNVNRLGSLGIPLDSIRAVGGGSSSPLWMQTKADVIGMPIHTLRDPEASGLGCVMMAATALGQFKDLHNAADALIAVKDTYMPDMSRHERYKERIREFERIYRLSKNATRIH
jgi:xylulokinase